MRVLIGSSGSYGDLYPFIAIGQELTRRGHDVRLFASAKFETDIQRAGLAAIPVGTIEDYDAVVRHPHAFHATKGFKLIIGTNLDGLPQSCELLEKQVVPGDTLVIGSTLALGTRLVAEKHRLPVATLHLAPAIFRSVFDTPAVGETRMPTWFPAPVKRFLYRAVDALVVDPVVCPRLNRFRAELGLKPVERVFDQWIHAADLVVGLFPDWFAAKQPDWPENVHLTGFPLYDGAKETPMPPEVDAFLDAGAPPVVFTAGTAATNESSFFRTSAEACHRLGRRGVLLTRFREQIPETLPETVRHFDYVPFTRILPRAAAVVHHGGIGTTSQALAAGTPQLIRPLAYDQHDNAYRLTNLDAGRWIRPSHYDAASVAHALDELTSSRTVGASCRDLAERLSGSNAVAATCDVLLDRLAGGAQKVL